MCQYELDETPLPAIVAEIESMSAQGLDVQYYLDRLWIRDEGARLRKD